METEKSNSQLAIGSSLLVFAVVFAGIWCFWYFVRGMLMNIVSFPFFVLIPGLIITRMLFIIFSRRSIGAKALRIDIYLWLIICVLFLGRCSSYKIHRMTMHNASERFAHVLKSSKRIETDWVQKLGAPESMCFHYYQTCAAIFRSNAHILLCQYNKNEYAAQKNCWKKGMNSEQSR